ncbi:hypothetical protein [Escherichia coli]|uniref:hypothetical protein n=1 Tax=Escherichia coli TaxID=562 RepID=UPI0019098B70|nr:hypothetical protein [Escherichia coli]MBK2451769.1 hypothetical protein [Escherichia coli]
MRHDPVMRAAARAIYETVFPDSDELSLTFEEAEQFRTPKYRRSVEATFEAKRQLGDDVKAQPRLL